MADTPLPEPILAAVTDVLERDFGDTTFRMVDGDAHLAVAHAAARAARIDELKRLLVGQETSYNLRTDEARPYVKSTVIKARIAELEVDR